MGTVNEAWSRAGLKRREIWAFEGAARTFLRLTAGTTWQMLNVSFDSAVPVTMAFARGDRAAELAEAFEVVRARHAQASAADGEATATPTPEASPESAPDFSRSRSGEGLAG